MNLEEMTLDIVETIEVKGPLEKVFQGVLHHFGEGSVTQTGESLQMHLEPWAGGRWYRDRGEGIGHLWGHVQVIKPPVLLELSGPMFMSYPALNHLEVKLEEMEGGTKVICRHRAVGMLDPAHREGVRAGWRHFLSRIEKDFSQ